jgi:hypothetical protein
MHSACRARARVKANQGNPYSGLLQVQRVPLVSALAAKSCGSTIVLQLLSSTGEAQPGVAPNTTFVRVMEPESHVAATIHKTHCLTADK